MSAARSPQPIDAATARTNITVKHIGRCDTWPIAASDEGQPIRRQKSVFKAIFAQRHKAGDDPE